MRAAALSSNARPVSSGTRVGTDERCRGTSAAGDACDQLGAGVLVGAAVAGTAGR